MAGTKRTKGSFDNDDYYEGGNGGGSSSKRVRFKNQRSQQRKRRESSSPPEDIEFDHEDMLEQKKKRRGAVNTEELSDDEEVGGGIYSSGSDAEDNDQDDKGKKTAAAADADDDFDMFSDSAPVETQQQQKNKSKGKRRLELNEIEGQELDSRNVDSEDEDGNKEPKLTAFNMRQEMEEGSFDQQGNYTVNKEDPEAIHDRWMEGVSRKDMAKAKDAQVRREQQEALKEAERQSNLPQTKNDVYRELLKFLKPGENVNQAIGKLGGGTNSATAKVPKWKQKLMEKKNRNKKQPKQQVGTEEEEAERQRKVERLTELADQMMALGHFGVYEDTFEEMVVHLRKEGVVPANWLPGTD
ncbi:hypothetical protein BDA99DRAFT_495198 [Phascolomyces articulosus]|uniref:Uncharacterized protein n=1 Tax=Phascolomyces articulosus TaxID=60185 RepID=A0AAD5PLR0_9FUNG|nr:hypothetical protein BDA99DRAFT_495198 [Phascolomyces articulosus]